MSGSGRNKAPLGLEFLGTSLAVQCLVLPVSAILSHQLSLVGFVANIPATFLVEWLTLTSLGALALHAAGTGLLWTAERLYPSFTADLNGLAVFSFLGRPITRALDALQTVAVYFSHVDYGRWPVASLNGLLIAGIFMLFMLLLFPLRRSWRQRLQPLSFAMLGLGVLLYLAVPIIQPVDRWCFWQLARGCNTYPDKKRSGHPD